MYLFIAKNKIFHSYDHQNGMTHKFIYYNLLENNN